MLEARIKELLLKQNKRVKDLCASIDMTDTGLRKIYARDSCELSTLRRIANFFNVPVCFFLEEQPTSNAVATDNSVAAINSEINIGDGERVKYLERLLEEKERTIQILMKK